MADLILHHYSASPFSEKIRLILGYKKLAWKLGAFLKDQLEVWSRTMRESGIKPE